MLGVLSDIHGYLPALAEPLAPTGNLSPSFRWNCAKGKLDGQILLAPTNPPAIHAAALATFARSSEQAT